MSNIQNNKINNITVYTALITFFIVCFYCVAIIAKFSGLYSILREPLIIHMSIIFLMATKMVLSVYGRQGFQAPIWMACCLFCAIIWGLLLYFTGLNELIDRNSLKIIYFTITLVIFLTLKSKIKYLINQKPTISKISIISFWALYFINPFGLYLSIY